MKIKADVTINSLGLISGKVYDTEFSEGFKKALSKEGFATEVKDNEVMQSEVDDYQNKSYPKYFLVIKDGSIYRAKVDTSETWVLSEWDLKVQGA